MIKSRKTETMSLIITTAICIMLLIQYLFLVTNVHRGKIKFFFIVCASILNKCHPPFSAALN